MKSGTAHRILNSKRSSLLDTIDTFMLCSMIPEQSVDIIHPRDQKDVSDKDQNTNDSFQQRQKRCISDIGSQEISNKKNDDKQFLRTATFPSDESESSICKYTNHRWRVMYYSVLVS